MAEGLGDTIEFITKVTGIQKVMPKNCGCQERKDKLNKLVPYKKKKNEEIKENQTT